MWRGLTIDDGTLAVSQGSCSGTTTLTCDFGIVANGNTVTVSYRVTVSGAGAAANTATVTAQAVDPDSSNNSATTSLTVEMAGGGCALIPPARSSHHPFSIP